MIKRVDIYTLLKKVGEGGMGTVYKAEDNRNGKIVAIKELDPQKAQIEDYRSRFSREERILTRLNHPNIVAPIKAFADEGTLYIAMEFVDGQSLDYKIRKISGPIPFIHARDLMIKMLEGFSHAHDAGIIHRDIKPANILISDSGELKITDFGIAKITTGEDRTTANIKLGTLCYMSPEQLTTADVDVRSDIYSLGMTFYEMLAGVLPFTKDQRENPGALTLRISNSEPYPLPSIFYPHIPKRIEDIVMKMLEKDINKRYESLKEVLNELQQFDLSDPERTLMEEYEKTVKFDPTILTQGKRSDSDMSATSASSSFRNKSPKEMTWEERQQRAKLLEEELREKLRQKKAEEQRIIEEQKRKEEEELRRRKEERIRKEREKQEEDERVRIESEQRRLEWVRKKAEEKAKKKKWVIRGVVSVIGISLIIFVYKGISDFLYGQWYDSELKNKFVLVEGGTFSMGSNDETSDEEPIHGVIIGSFLLGKIEVTQELWESVMGSNPSNFKGDKRPVERVSWNDVVEFCNKLSEKEGLQKAYSGSGDNVTCDFNSNGYRLPTEAEWEYAARGGKKSKGYTYSGSNDIDAVSWYRNNSGSTTHEVGTKQPNELGIFDMSGNVWEWCWDWYGDYTSTSQTNPKGANAGSNRVIRGGGWSNYAGYCRVANRGNDIPGFRYYDLGFRLVRTKS